MRTHVHHARTTGLRVVVVILAVLLGVSVPSGATSHLAPGALQVSLPDHLRGCDPVGHVVNSSTAQVLSLVLPSAYTSTPNGTVSQADSFLDQAEVVDLNPLTVDYQLKATATWATGSPIGLPDFIASWKIGAAGNGAAAAEYRAIKSIKGGLSKHQVVVTFKRPTSSWQSLFSPLLPGSVVPSTLLSCTGPSAVIDESAGPFEILSSTPSTILLAKNPRWWGPAPPVALVQVTGGTPPTASTSSLVASLTERTWLTSPELDGLTSEPSTNSTVEASNRILSLNFNVRSGPTASATVRRAISRLIDRQAIVAATATNIDPNVAVAGSSLLSQAQPGYSGPSPVQSNSTTTTSTTSDAQGSPPATIAPSSATTAPGSLSQLQQVNKLLTRAGLTHSNGSWLTRDRRPLTLSMAVPLDDGWALESAALLAAQLRADDLHVTLTFVPSSAASARSLVSTQTSMGLIARPTDPFIGHAVAWFSRTPGVPASMLWSGFTSKAITTLAQRASTDMNPQTAEPLYAAINSSLLQAVPTWPLYTEPLVTAWSSTLTGVDANPYPPGTLSAILAWAPASPNPPTSG